MSRTITIKLTEADYAAANRLHLRRGPLLLLAWALLAVAGYLIVITAMAESDELPVPLVGAVLIGLGVSNLLGPLLVWPIVTQWRTRRVFQQSKMLQERTELAWTDDRLLFKGETWNATVAWSDFVKYRENKTLLLLYPNDISFRMIPKRAFSDEASLSDFAQLMRTKIRGG